MSMSCAFQPPSSQINDLCKESLLSYSDLLGKESEYTLLSKCIKHINKVSNSTFAKGVTKPTLDDIVSIKESIFKFSMFSISIETLLDDQRKRFPKLIVPWVIVALSEAIISLGGFLQEGIFRVPGEVDAINDLKRRLDSYLDIRNDDNPHVCASLLKLWCRELPQPLISENLYEECTEYCEDIEKALEIIKNVPTENYLTICFLVKFLRKFMEPSVVEHTRMSTSNIAMVWSPNFIRCPFVDPSQIFLFSRKETLLITTLLNNLNTDCIADSGKLE